MPFTPKQVYKSENLRFATESDGRKPTMYFRTNHGSGRLRQGIADDAVPTGKSNEVPKVQEIRKHTTHAFFETRKQQRAFHTEVGAAGTDLTRTQYRALRKKHGGHHTPQEKYFHHEASFQGHSGDSKVNTRGSSNDKARLHISGGQVVSSQKLQQLRQNTSTIATGMGVGD